MNNHRDWFDSITGGASKAEAARRTGIANSTLSHQYRHAAFSATSVIAIAKAYGKNPIRALLQTGYLSQDNVDAMFSPTPIDAFTDQQLVRELALRINSTPAHWEGTFEEVFERNNVIDLPTKSNTSAKDVPPAWDSDGTMPEDAVAKDGKEWGQPDDDDY